MTDPRTGTCEPWSTTADLCHPCSDKGPTPSVGQHQAASDILHDLSGRQFPGHCTVTVRPTPRVGPDLTPGWYHRDFGFVQLSSSDADMLSQSHGWANLGSEERSGPSWLSAISLGYRPLDSITSVKIDGATLDPSLYRIDDYQYLVRLPDANGSRRSWPLSQRLDLPDTAVGTFSVTIVYGRRPPPGGVNASAVLACEFARACGPNASDCRLPQRVTQVIRQGISQLILDPQKFFDKGRVGLYEVDLWLQSVNPKGIQSRATVMSPDLWPAARRTTWP